MKDIKQIQGWQPIETAPKNYRVRILAYPVYSKHSTTHDNDLVKKTNNVGVVKRLTKYGASNSWDESNFCWKNDNNKIVFPTHWMPLPTPPEED